MRLSNLYFNMYRDEAFNARVFVLTHYTDEGVKLAAREHVPDEILFINTDDAIRYTLESMHWSLERHL